jgi:hypothetical protein
VGRSGAGYWALMHLMKTLWSSVQHDPRVMRRLNGWLTVFWIAMIPASALLGWLSSVAYVSALSLWALVSGHWAAWQAARVEVAQEQQSTRERNGSRNDRTKKNTEPVAPSSTTPTSFPSGPKASTYDP